MRAVNLIAVLFLIGCGAQPQEKVPSLEEVAKLEQVVDTSLPLVQQAYSIETQEVCERQGGSWKKIGRQQSFGCVLPTADAGNVCNDSRECEVACIVDDNDIKAGEEVQGVCLNNTDLLGCRSYVSNGVVEQTLCVD
ncbi:hypothetical protein [Alteromonas gracilis]|uniref:hypothetical protein n=1 Tax=Alteromonas gracilis TaxID=1479524 RepID=UPI00373693B6